MTDKLTFDDWKKLKLLKDGNCFCITGPDFVDLQTSPAVFIQPDTRIYNAIKESDTILHLEKADALWIIGTLNDQVIGNRMIKGGEGSHWQGCEETHYDCRIKQLEAENKRLSDELKTTTDELDKIRWLAMLHSSYADNSVSVSETIEDVFNLHDKTIVDIVRLREGLDFYANKKNYANDVSVSIVQYDDGKIAREALRGET